MNPKYKKWLWRLLWALPFFLFLCICLLYLYLIHVEVEWGLQREKTGIVLDADTRQPIAGAYVMARWLKRVTNPFFIGHGTGGMEGGCLYWNVVRTDDQGEFILPSTVERFEIESNFRIDRSIKYLWDFTVYAPSYGAPQHDRSPMHDENFPNASPWRPTIKLFEHPDVNWSSNLFGRQHLENVLLSKDQRSPVERVAYLNSFVGIGCNDLPLTTALAQTVYQEAFKLACTREQPSGTLFLTQLRRALISVLGTLPSATNKAIEAIEQRNVRYVPPASSEDERLLCTLLSKNTRLAEFNEAYASKCATQEPRGGLEVAYWLHAEGAPALSNDIKQQVEEIEKRYRPYTPGMAAIEDEKNICILLKSADEVHP